MRTKSMKFKIQMVQEQWLEMKFPLCYNFDEGRREGKSIGGYFWWWRGV